MDDTTHVPLAPFPSNTTDWTNTHATLVTVAGQRLLLLPFAAPVGSSRGRKFLVRFDGESHPRQRVVLAVAGAAAMPAPLNLPESHSSLPLAIRALPQQRDRRLPKDLLEAIEQQALSLDHAPDAELLQLIVMLNESASADVRQQRLQAAVQVITSWNRHG